METLLTRLRESGMRGALIGPEGHGKSTLLRELAVRLDAEGFATRLVRLREGERTVPSDLQEWLATADSHSALLLDSAEQLSIRSWLMLRFRSRRLGAFVVTTHRGGRMPPVIRCGTSAELLGELLDELAPDRPPGFPSPDELWTRHRGNIRTAMFEAYDSWK